MANGIPWTHCEEGLAWLENFVPTEKIEGTRDREMQREAFLGSRMSILVQKSERAQCYTHLETGGIGASRSPTPPGTAHEGRNREMGDTITVHMQDNRANKFSLDLTF